MLSARAAWNEQHGHSTTKGRGGSIILRAVALWPRNRGQRGNCPGPLNFNGKIKIFRSSIIIHVENPQLSVKIVSKICRVCWKITTPCDAYFFTNDTTAWGLYRGFVGQEIFTIHISVLCTALCLNYFRLYATFIS